MKPMHWIAGDNARPVVSWLETLVIAAASAGVAFWLRPEDPLFTRADFPWPVLVPLLVALRYGFAHGLIGALVVTLPGVVVTQSQALPLSYVPVLGMLCIALAAGEFRDVWNRRLLRLRRVSEHSAARLAEFTGSYHLLRLSHDWLEQRLAGSTRSLRGAVLEVQRSLGELAESGADDLLAAAAPRLLELFSEYGSLTAASLHAVDTGPVIRTQPLARIGEASPVDAADPLVELALESGEVASVAPADGAVSDAAGATRLVAAVPLVSPDGRRVALVAVHDMPFFALTRPSLQLLAVLGGHAGGLIETALASRVRDPEAQSFLQALRQALADARRHRLGSVVAAMTFPDCELAGEILSLLRLHSRGLDSTWLTRSEADEPVLAVLLPFTDSPGFVAYRDRLEELVREQRGHGLDELGVTMRSVVLDGNVDEDGVHRLLTHSVVRRAQPTHI